MGRTNPTYRDLLRRYREEWQPYRRALRHGDQPHFDQLFEYAAAHADAAGYLNARDPFDPVLVSIALEQERRITELEARLNDAIQD